MFIGSVELILLGHIPDMMTLAISSTCTRKLNINESVVKNKIQLAGLVFRLHIPKLFCHFI